LSKIKTLHPQKHPISYGYVSGGGAGDTADVATFFGKFWANLG